MTADEVKVFEQDPLFQEKLHLRSWDDAGKVEGLEIPPLSTYRDLLRTHLQN